MEKQDWKQKQYTLPYFGEIIWQIAFIGFDHFLKFISLTLKRLGYFWSSKVQGGLNQPPLSFCAPVLPISIQIIHKWSQMRAGIFIHL